MLCDITKQVLNQAQQSNYSSFLQQNKTLEAATRPIINANKKEAEYFACKPVPAAMNPKLLAESHENSPTIAASNTFHKRREHFVEPYTQKEEDEVNPFGMAYELAIEKARIDTCRSEDSVSTKRMNHYESE